MRKRKMSYYLLNLWWFVCFCLLSVFSQERNIFYGRPQHVTELVGGSVRFRCKVKTLSINQAVAWMKSDRAGLTTEWLTSGTEVIAPEPLAERLKVVGTTRSNLRYDLLLKDLDYTDDGLYICNVLTFGEQGITAQTRSSGNALRVVSARTTLPVTTTAEPTTAIPETLQCEGIDPMQEITVGEVITIRCVNNLHRYTSRDDSVHISWAKNNRTITSRRFAPNIPVTGRGTTLAGTNLTVEFTFKVERFDDEAIFVCTAIDSERRPTSTTCSLGPLRISAPIEVILSGRSVVYVEEGDGIRLYCPRPPDTEGLQMYWSQTPFLPREKYTLTAGVMYIVRLEAEDDRQRVACTMTKSRRVKKIGEVVIRVTRNGWLITNPPPVTTPMKLTLSPTIEGLDENFLGGSGAGVLEITQTFGKPDTTLQLETTTVLSTTTKRELTTTVYPTTPAILTTGEDALPDELNIGPFDNFLFPPGEPDWLKEGTSPSPAISKSHGKNSANRYPSYRHDTTILMALFFTTPTLIVVIILICIILVVCGPTNRLNRSLSTKSRSSVPDIRDDSETMWTSKPSRARQPNIAVCDRPPIPRIQIDEDPPLSTTHYYEPMEWDTNNGGPAHFERDHTKLQTFGHYDTPFSHVGSD